MSEDKSNNDAGQDTGEEEATPLTLDELTEQEQNSIREDYNSNRDEEEGEDDAEESDDTGDDDAADDSDDSDDPDEGSEEDDGEEDADGDEDDDDTQNEDEEPEDKVEDKPAPSEFKAEDFEIDRDVTKEGKYKAKFVDLDDKEYHIFDTKDLPDDFEPKNYKQFLMATDELNQKRTEYARDRYKFTQEQAKAQREEQISKIQEGWDKDIERLTKAGTLPKAEKDRKKVIDEVFTLMENEMKKGRVIDSWETAYDKWEVSKLRADRVKKREQRDQLKKKNGSKVQGSSNNNRGTVIEAPRTGMTLDDVHTQAVGEL